MYSLLTDHFHYNKIPRWVYVEKQFTILIDNHVDLSITLYHNKSLHLHNALLLYVLQENVR